ncbi:MAG: diaminopropionate ammonia-lyase [Clostridium thermopalmarium]|uniref:diaminopropionate ammonia-lyase n=1 Tax=Clostridium thermopalmarium TaxID=29373 RepID=UPI0023552C33|nr:diaminopropionate ammonia-lyase [Clostridium thermopalmarium]MBE6044896.1 diaminopropionate ammonia-lyase [Clostridium thermopalmarium]
MIKKVKWKANTIKVDKKVDISFLSKKEIGIVKKFHESFPQYSRTPLVSLDNLSKKLGVGGIYIKDESYRFGLNAFKVLGGSFAMSKYLAKRTGKDISELSFEKLTYEEVRKELGEITFATTTDGNHGRGVAWTANQLKQKSVVYMPKGSSQTRLENIRKEGATASILDMNYDDAVRFTAEQAEKYGWVVVQDTAWEGYEEIPTWIMQGYGTMAYEALEQLQEYGVERPTHIFIQAGVGSLAGAVQGFFASVFEDNVPITLIAEADEAACFYKSVVAGDGNPRVVGGDMPTIMAGLACGEPNVIGWEVLKSYSSVFAACPDWVAASGMRILGNPLKGDERVISGESGAVTLGLLNAILTREEYSDLRRELKLDENSKILLFSTEGDTDPDKYRHIVWDGEYPSY